MSNGQVKKRAQLGTLEKEMSGANIIKNQTNNLSFSTLPHWLTQASAQCRKTNANGRLFQAEIIIYTYIVYNIQKEMLAVTQVLSSREREMERVEERVEQ